MDKVHEKHQTQMMQMWHTMTSHEQSQMIKKMEKMIEKMESKNMSKHMKMMDKEMHGEKTHYKHSGDKKFDKTQERTMKSKTPVYNETLNPRQIDYPNVLGFNDLHIHANRHTLILKDHLD